MRSVKTENGNEPKSHGHILLNKTRFRYVAITASKEEVMKSIPSTFVIDSSSLINKHTSLRNKPQPSGVVLLLFAKLEHNWNYQSSLWTQSKIHNIEAVKKNILPVESPAG